MVDEALYNAKCAEVNQQRDHFRIETRNYERFEQAARKEIAELKREKERLTKALAASQGKLLRARQLAHELSRI